MPSPSLYLKIDEKMEKCYNDLQRKGKIVKTKKEIGKEKYLRFMSNVLRHPPRRARGVNRQGKKGRDNSRK